MELSPQLGGSRDEERPNEHSRYASLNVAVLRVGSESSDTPEAAVHGMKMFFSDSNVHISCKF